MACCCGIPRGLSVALSGPLPWVVWAEEEVMVALPLSSEASEWIGACRVGVDEGSIVSCPHSSPLQLLLLPVQVL